jgi:hypothetical protein
MSLYRPGLGKGELTADLQEPFLLLSVLGNIDLVNIVLQTQLFKGNMHFVAIRCACISLVCCITEAYCFGYLRCSCRLLSVPGTATEPSLEPTGQC